MTVKRIYNSLPAFIMAIDWETSGYSTPNYASKHQGISFGAAIVDAKSLVVLEAIYHEIKFDPKYEWSMGAEGVHGLTREHLEKNGISQQEAAVELCSLVMKFMGDGEVPVLGHRVYFDKAFTDQLTNTIEIQLPWHPIMFDSCSLSSLMLEQTSSDALFDMMGLPPRSAHNAMEDILYTVASVKKIKEFFLAGVVAGT